MNRVDQAAIRQGVRHILVRREQARERAVSAVQELGGIDPAAAAHVVTLYIQKKVLKFNGLDYRPIHGAYYDRDALVNAAAYAEGREP